MMIRINLLPIRQVQKREMGRQYLVIAAGVTVAALVGNFLWYSKREGVADDWRSRVRETEERIAQLEKTIGEVNKLNQRKKEVQEKLAVLERLRKARSGPVRVLDALATCIPKKVFITTFTESNAAVSVSGSGESYEDVSEFMKALAGIVWTPKGIGRILERNRNAATTRVELLAGESVVEDYSAAEVGHFFTKVELKSTTLDTGGKSVKFDITMTTSYAI